MTFDQVIVIDWSAANDRGPTPKRDAIWMARGDDDPIYCRNRQLAESALRNWLRDAQIQHHRTLVAFDFSLTYPRGFSKAVTGSDDPLAIWDWLEARIADSPTKNNRFEIAAQINRMFGGVGPFWGHAGGDYDGLMRTKAGYHSNFADKRDHEAATRGAFSPWQLTGAGSVGSQILMGLPVLARLRRDFAAMVWPYDPIGTITIAETWTGIFNPWIKPLEQAGEIRDRAQVRLMAECFAAADADLWERMLAVGDAEEGAILGAGFADKLIASRGDPANAQR